MTHGKSTPIKSRLAGLPISNVKTLQIRPLEGSRLNGKPKRKVEPPEMRTLLGSRLINLSTSNSKALKIRVPWEYRLNGCPNPRTEPHGTSTPRGCEIRTYQNKEDEVNRRVLAWPHQKNTTTSPLSFRFSLKFLNNSFSSSLRPNPKPRSSLSR